MSNRLLAESGAALFGPRWQSELATALEVDRRTIARWLSGVSDTPSGVYMDILRLSVERRAALDDLDERLKREGAPG